MRHNDFAISGFRNVSIALLASLLMTVFGVVLISSIFIGSAFGQDFKRPDGSVPLPLDWSDRHVVYTADFTGEQAERMQGDPRYFVAMRMHAKALADQSAAHGYPIFMRTAPRGSPAKSTWEAPREPLWESLREPLRGSPREPPWESPIRLRRNAEALGLNTLKTDWSVSLGPTAGVAAGQFPAKFTYDVNATPSCTADYAVFPVNAATGSTRTHVVGTFSTTGGATGQTVTFTVTPTGGSSVMLTLTSSTSTTTGNTGKNFQVFTTGSTANATTSASNLAAAINRNLSATNAAAIVAVVSSTTVTVYTLTPGTQVTLSATETLSNLSFGGVTAGTNGTQANIVGFNNLYSGSGSPLCSSKTFPTFIFSYASGVGSVTTSPVISLDGKKIAYIENGPGIGMALHVLTFASGSTEFGSCTNSGTALPTCATHPVIPGSTANSTATDFVVPLSVPTLGIVATDTRSAPFVNYSTDVLYVGDDQGHLYAVTGVFQGTPTLAGGNFPVTVSSSGNILNSPVVDVSGTGDIFLGDSGSNTYEYNSAGVIQGPSVSIGNGTNGGIWDGAIVDSTNSKAYFTTNCSGTGGNSGLSQIPFTNTGFGTVVTSVSTNGSGCSTSLPIGPQYAPTPDNLYYTAGITNGHIIVSYQGTSSVRLAQWGFLASGALNTTRQADSNFLTSAGTQSVSPSTEFFSSNNNVAYKPTALTQSGNTVTVTTAINSFATGQVVAIAGVATGSGCSGTAVAAINGQQTITVTSPTTFTFTSAASASITGGCSLASASATGALDLVFFGTTQPAVFAFTLPMPTTTGNQAPVYTNTTSVAGGTSGIIVDNNSTSGQASSIYFGTQAASSSQCGGTTSNPTFCAVKLTQTGLN